MELDSARELKSRVLESLISTAPASEHVISSLGVSARSLKEVDHVQRGIAVGIQARKRGEYRLAVRIQRRSLEAGPHLESIRRMAREEVDIRYIGHVSKQAGTFFREPHRPLLIGTSIGHFSVTAGTLGCFVRRKDDGKMRILSNNHVLANENRATQGDAIIQPGDYDGGSVSKNRVGSLDSYVTLRRTSTNLVDCAIADLKRGVESDARKLHTVGRLAGLAPDPEEYDLVEKLGRTTGHTLGRVSAFEVDDVTIEYDLGNLRFNGQIEIEGRDDGPFSLGGDSGSLIFTSGEHLAVGLLFAGSDQGGKNGKGLTYANPLARVLRRLDCELVT